MSDPKKAAAAATAKTIIKHLERNGFDGYFCESSADAQELVKQLVAEGSTIAWGGTETFKETGVKAVLESGNYVMLDRSTATTPEETRAMYMSHLASDCFFMSTNAITTQGELVNIDGNSNRLACLLFGPKQVIVLVGMNKVCADIDSAIKRVQTAACPPNAARLHPNTPCEFTGVCGKCHSEGCMCCNIVISRHNRHAGRVKVILIAEDLGF